MRKLIFKMRDPRFMVRGSGFEKRNMSFEDWDWRFMFEDEYLDDSWYWINDGKFKILFYIYDIEKYIIWYLMKNISDKYFNLF